MASFETGSAMSRPNRSVLAPFVFILAFTSVFSPKFMVLGSPVQERRFKRLDPLNHFQYYTAGYNVTNKHYWASAAFTGVHGYAVAGIWMLCGLVFGIFMIFKNLCSSSSPITYHLDNHYFLMFMLLLLLTFLAICACNSIPRVASSFVLAASESCLRRTQKLKKIIVRTGGSARKTIRSVANVMTEMEYLLNAYNPETTMRLNATVRGLRNESLTIQSFVQKSGNSIDLAIYSSYLFHLVVATINLVLLVMAPVLLLLHWQPGLIIIIFLFWILTTLCWFLTGVDFFLHSFADDTCSAFEGFVQNPANNTLSSSLPCKDLSSTNKVLAEISNDIHSFITKMNSNIKQVYRLLRVDEQNKDALGFSKICDPFSDASIHSYISENCPNDTITIGHVPNVLSKFTCYKENSSEACRNNGLFLPESSYQMIWAFSRAIEDMIKILPDLQNLSRCTIVKDTFSDVVRHQCKPFRMSFRLLWSSMLSLSTVMVVLVLTLVKVNQDRGRCFSRCFTTP